MTKVIIIGLDGATFDVLDPLIKEGHIPNIEYISNKGAKAKLKSVYPPITAPAWTSFATGKNPGKTGVFDFRNRVDESSFELKSINSHTFRKAEPYWDTISKKGYRVGVYNYPFLYPPYKINGYMTSGTGCGPEQEITFPKALQSKLKSASKGRYKIQIPYAEKKYQKNLKLFMKDAFEILDCNKSHIEYFMMDEFDVCTYVINVSDFAQHYMWDNILDGPLTDLDNKYKCEFVKIWKKIDKLVGLIIKANPDSYTFIVSDHGFGPNKYTFYINSWLEYNGFVVKSKNVRMKTWFKFQKKVGKIIEIIGKYFPSISRRLWRHGEKRTKPFVEKFDMDKTKIFSLPQSNDSGKLWINHQTVSEEEIESLLKDVKHKLKNYFEKREMQIDFFNKEDIYKGDYLKYAPDIFFKVNDYECSVHYSFNEGPFLLNKPDNPNRSGSHKRHGIFLAYGPEIKCIDMNELSILDIAPTILHLFDIPIPKDMDGKVLKIIFDRDSSVSKKDIKFVSEEEELLNKSITSLKQKKGI